MNNDKIIIERGIERNVWHVYLNKEKMGCSDNEEDILLRVQALMRMKK